MKTLLIVYHSMTGGTLQLARAAAAGASAEPGVRVSLSRAVDVQPPQVIDADGYVFASPEYLASMAGQMKDFFDRCYYAALDRLNGRPYLSLVCAGSDGSGAMQQIARIATGWRLKQIAEPLIVRVNAQAPEDIQRPKVIGAEPLERCRELGATMAAGLGMGVF
jgi:multimeric flavodoxin WrbA